MKANKEKLKHAMTKACFNPKDLIKASGLSRAAISKVLAGRPVSTRTMGLVIRALGVEPDDILEDVKIE